MRIAAIREQDRRLSSLTKVRQKSRRPERRRDETTKLGGKDEKREREKTKRTSLAPIVAGYASGSIEFRGYTDEFCSVLFERPREPKYVMERWKHAYTDVLARERDTRTHANILYTHAYSDYTCAGCSKLFFTKNKKNSKNKKGERNPRTKRKVGKKREKKRKKEKKRKIE